MNELGDRIGRRRSKSLLTTSSNVTYLARLRFIGWSCCLARPGDSALTATVQPDQICFGFGETNQRHV